MTSTANGTNSRETETADLVSDLASTLAGLEPEELLAVAADTDRLARVADLRRIECALAWALAHPADPGQAALGYVETAGGQGTPDIEEFTADPLAAVWSTTCHATRQLIADALDLRFRLPRTWARVQALEVPGWRARRIAQATSALSQEAAAAVDAALAPRAHRCGTRAIDTAIAQATAHAEPAEQLTDEQAERRHWKVQLFHGEPTGPCRWVGTSTMIITGDTTDLTHLHDQITTTAQDPDLPRTRPGDTPETRQALAVGALARRMAGNTTGNTTGGKPPRVRLYLHAQAADLADDTIGCGSVERLGPLSMATIKDWVGHSAVTVLPVLHTDRADAVDQHDPPTWMRELVILRDRHCVHPYCETDARACDLDHITEYLPLDQGGPPGQTRPDNLAPLCRHHHRAKTHRRWHYQRHPDGTYHWTGPHQHRYRVTPAGTQALPPPDPRLAGLD